MKPILFFAVLLALFYGCETQQKKNIEVLKTYIKAANEHNLEKVKEMYSDSISWYFGPFTFKGKQEAIAPLKFDRGANTLLVVSNIKVNEDTVDFDLLETNDVITALGIKQLHHFPRFIIKDGLILKKLSRKPPLEFQAFSDSVSAFGRWLSANLPEIYDKFWPSGNFNFSEETGQLMPIEVMKWRERFNK